APVVAAPSVDGAALFASTCAACHQPDGKGLAGQFPPLAQSDFLAADKTRAIQTVLGGRSGEITVNGATYNGVMPPWAHLSDADIAALLTYVRGSFGNKLDAVTPAEVAKERTP